MIYSVKVIDKTGMVLIDRHYSEPTEEETLDSNVISGMLLALAQFCEHLTRDEIQTITFGNSQFFFLKYQDLLFVLHTDLTYSRYLSLAKLQRIKESFVERYIADETSLASLRNGNEDVHQGYLLILDELLRERTAVELEIMVDYFLTGKGIIGTYIRDIKKNEVVLAQSPPELVSQLNGNSKLFEIFFKHTERNFDIPNDDERYVIHQVGDCWLVGIKQSPLLFLSLFRGELDLNIVMDIIHGTLGELLQFIAEYFQDFEWTESNQKALIVGNSVESAILARLLEFDGFLISQADTVESALANMRTKLPKIAIYDMDDNPNIVAFFEEVTSDPQLAKIPFFLLRSKTSSPETLNLDGANTFDLFKPVQRVYVDWIKHQLTS